MRQRYADPTLGERVEWMIQQYPSVTPDLVAGLVVSGQLDMEGGLLDELMRKDAAAQQNNAFWYAPWSAAKWTVRNAYVIAEDLYNLSPVMSVPRTLINMNQGRPFNESVNHALESNARRNIRMSRIGIDYDYGDGWIPSQDVLPQSPEYWGLVKEMIESGQLAGTPEEQLLTAMNQQRIDSLYKNGINTHALTVQTWRSTHLHKTLADGTVVETPFSPGAGLAMPFFAPGTLAFQVASGVLDTGFRLVFEPVDVPFDRGLARFAGRGRHAGDDFHFAGGVDQYDELGKLIDDTGTVNRRRFRNFMRENMNIEIWEGPIPLVVSMNRKYGLGAKYDLDTQGMTQHLIDPDTGKPIVEVSLDAHPSQVIMREPGKPANPKNAYVQGYLDTGHTLDEIEEAIDLRGGKNGQIFLTIEHEGVHVEQMTWFGKMELDDGRMASDYWTTTKNTPDDLRKLIDDGIEEHGNPINRLAEDAAETTAKIDELDLRFTQLSDELQVPNLDPARKLAAQKEIGTVVTQQSQRKRHLNNLSKVIGNHLDEMELIQGKISHYIERHATRVSTQRMLDGTWGAPKTMKEFRRVNGVSGGGWRPTVNVPSFTEVLWTEKGRDAMRRFANDFNDYDSVVRHAPGIPPAAAHKIAASSDAREITKIFSDLYRGPGTYKTPKGKKFGNYSDPLARGLDAWQSKTHFNPVPFIESARRLARRGGAEAGHNILRVGDDGENMKVVSSTLRTAGSEPERIYEIQKLAMAIGNTRPGIGKIKDLIRDEVIAQAKLVGGNVEAQTTHIMKQWDIAEKQTHIYAVNPTTGRARLIWHNGKKWVHRDGERIAQGNNGAMFESQFAETAAVVPNVRQIRRLTSRQREAYEGIRRHFGSYNDANPYLPLGMESSGFMRFADWGFGIWRDMALFRLGWALRILPEEHLRLGASGYSNLFSNPLDYFTMLSRNLDFIAPGETKFLSDIIGADGLGTAMLRDLKTGQKFDAEKVDWAVVSMGNPNEAELAWAGMTRDFLVVHNDEVGRLVAEMGVDDAFEWLMTAAGYQVRKRIVVRAQKNSGLDKIMNQKPLADYLDAVDLKINEMGGGAGVYKELEDDFWYNSLGQRVHAFSDTTAFRTRESLIEFIKEHGGDMALSRSKRKRSRFEGGGV
jgi:hypothetical protein